MGGHGRYKSTWAQKETRGGKMSFTSPNTDHGSFTNFHASVTQLFTKVAPVKPAAPVLNISFIKNLSINIKL